MFSTRVSRELVRTIRTGIRRISTQTHRQIPTGWRYGTGVTVSAVAATAIGGLLLASQHDKSTIECAPASVPLTAATATSAATSEEIQYYQPTFSRRAKLPKTPEEIAKYSLEQLANVYDPTKPDNAIQPLAHAMVWGTPLPPEGSAPIELLFTDKDPDPIHRHFELLVRTIQDRICNDLIDVEHMPTAARLETAAGVEMNDELRTLLTAQGTTPAAFRQEIVIRPNGTGGGVTRVLSGGRVFCKAGVSVSVANVKPPPEAFERLKEDHPSLKDIDFKGEFTQWTAAVSLVLHPVSPHVPTCHANWRIFDLTFPDGRRVWWVGGGSDLTPTYVVDEDAKHFHTKLKDTLKPFGHNYYNDWKKWADKYFFIKHRLETRGVGGVFFDDLHTEPLSHYEHAIRRMGESFSAQYFPIVLKNKDKPFNETELAFQQLRRGRYAEFNLVYDKGTQHGLKAVYGRPEGILMSLPPVCRFMFRQQFNDPREKYTKEVLEHPKEWA